MRRPFGRLTAATLLLASCSGDPAAPDRKAPDPTISVTIAGARTYTFATIGRTVTLSATASAGATVTWVSSDSAVARVGAAGGVTAVGNGFALIIAQAGAGRDTVQVSVTQTPAGLALPAGPSPVAVGTRAAFLVVITDSGGTLVPSFSGDVHLALTRNPAGGTLSGTLSRIATAGYVWFDDLVIGVPGNGYALTASTSFAAAESPPFTVLAGPDLVRFHNAPRDSVGMVFGGFKYGNTYFLQSVGSDSVFTTVLQRAPQLNEVTGFARGRRPLLFKDAPWTAGVDTFDLAFRGPVRIPITVWIVDHPYASVAGAAAEAILAAAKVWDAERVGIEFGAVTVVDASANPDTALVLRTTGCDQQLAAETRIGKAAGQINVYYVEKVEDDLFHGFACGGGTIFMASLTHPDLLAHEIGHTLGLGHVDGLDTFGPTNVMHSSSRVRQYLTEGQIFRAHFLPQTALGTVYGIAHEVRGCTGLNDFCLPLQGRLWADGPVPAASPAPVSSVTEWLENDCRAGEAGPDRPSPAAGLEAELRAVAAEGPSAARRAEIARVALARHADLERFRTRLRPGDPLANVASLIPFRSQEDVVRRAVADAVFSYRARAAHALLSAARR